MKGPRNHAIERSQLARRAKPLGEFIVEQMHKRIPGPPRVPAETPRNGSGGTVRAPTQASRNVRRKRTRGGASVRGTEAPVLHDCLKWLHAHGVFAWRNNTGTAWINGQPVSFGYPGSADITGILPDGRRLEIECKSATGKQSDKQKKFQANIERNHGVYILVRSVKELEQSWVIRSLGKSE
jgi:hypothetical protein